MRKATNRTSYKEVCALYEATGRTDYRLQTVNDIKVIHGFDILETTGYEDLTEEQKETFVAYVLKHLNSVGMNTRITMFPYSVHYVREISLLSAETWCEEDQRNYREELGREYLIVKANGKTKKWKNSSTKKELKTKLIPGAKRNFFASIGSTEPAANGSTFQRN